MKYITLVLILCQVLALCYAAQTSKSWNFALRRRGARSMGWGRILCQTQEKTYVQCTDLICPCSSDGVDFYHYRDLFSDSRKSTCVFAANSNEEIIGLAQLTVVKRIFVRLSSSSPCTFKILASNAGDTKVSESIIDITTPSVLGAVEFLPHQVNPQNKAYGYFGIYASNSNGVACSICALEMFTN